MTTRSARKALLLLLLLGAAPAAAEKGLRFHPEVRGSVVYDDNVYLEEDAESDFAFGLAPRVEATFERGRLRAGADVGLDARFYADHSDLNETFWRVGAHVEVEPVRGLTLRLADHYVPQPVALGRPEDDAVNLRQSNTLVAEARYWRELKREASLELGIRSVRFDSDDFDAVVDADGDGFPEERRLATSHWGVDGWVEGTLPLGRRTSAFARAQLRHRAYDELEAADFGEVAGTLGVRTRIGARLHLEASAGYGILDFAELDSDDRLLGRLHVRYDLGRDWTLSATLLQRLTGDATGSDFGETSARLGVEWRLGPRTRLEGGVFWGRYDHELLDVDLTNRVFAAELRLRRQVTRRMEAVLAWRRWRNRGDLDDDDFTQNRVSLGLVYRF